MKIVTAAIIENKGSILIAKRKKGDRLEDKWEFPGGKLESNETPQECLKRELMEEFSVDTEVADFFFSTTYNYDHSSIRLDAYRVLYKSGKFLLKDHDAIEWVAPSDFYKYEFAPADIPIVEKLVQEYAPLGV